MAPRQQAWNKHEASILLEAYLDFFNSDEPRLKYICRASEDLRRMAFNQGYEIDDIFRNINGITFQMSSMESAYLGYTKIKPATKLFSETVALYNEDRAAFDKLLKEAKAMVSGIKSNKDRFMDILASQIGASKLSTYVYCYNEIETFCKRTRILKQSLFETTDFETIQRVQKTIERDKIFIITHRKNHGMIVSAGRLYYQYIKGISSHETNESCSDEKTREEQVSDSENEERAEITTPQVESGDMCATKPDSTTAVSDDNEERIKQALKKECQKNKFGTTLVYLQEELEIPVSEIWKIVKAAPWAAYRYGKLYFVNAEENQGSVSNDNVNIETVAKANSEFTSPESKKSNKEVNNETIEIVRTEEDKHLYSKYPLIYKKIFNALKDISEHKREGTTIASLYNTLNRIARCADIETILDNVSWAKNSGKYYTFSNEIVDHKVADELEIKPVNEEKHNNPAGIYTVDFSAPIDLAYTFPLSVNYFGKQIDNLNSWAAAYVEVVSCLFSDFTNCFRTGMSFSSRGVGRLDLGSSAHRESMVAPRQLRNQSLFVETNISASNIVGKIKYLLDVCSVDYRNVVIQYAIKGRAISSSSQIGKDNGLSTQQRLTGVRTDSVQTEFETYLHDVLLMAERTCRGYSSSINGAERFAKEHGFKSTKIYTSDKALAKATVLELMADAEFRKFNAEQHNRFSAALKKYLMFIGEESIATYFAASTPAQPEAERTKIYQKLYSISRVYDDPMGLAFDRIMAMLGPGVEERIAREILDDASWVTKLTDDVYSFSKKTTRVVREPTAPYVATSGYITDTAFFKYLNEQVGMADVTSRSYVSAIRTAEGYAQDNHYVPCKLYGCSSTDTVELIQKLLSDTVFMEFNTRQHNRFSAAFTKLLEMAGQSNSTGRKIVPSPIVPTKTQPGDFDKSKFEEALLRRYRNGMQFDSIDFENFREMYDMLFDEKLTFDDADLEERLRYCGVIYKDRLFPAEGIIDSDTKEKLFAYIDNSFASGKKVLYFKAIYEDLEDTFASCFSLSDEKMLKAFIEYSAEKEKYFFFSDYMSTERHVTIDHNAEVEEFLLNAGKPMQVDDVCVALSHIPQDQVNRIISTDSRFLRNAKGEYFHVGIFEISDEELDRIAEIINGFIDDNEYAIWTDIWNEIQDKMPVFLENNLYLSWLGVRNAIAQHYIGRFNFEGAVISLPKDRFAMRGVYQLYAKHHAKFTSDDIYNLSKELDTVIYFDALAEVSVRVSNNLFISKEQISFDVDAIDKAIGSFMAKDYIRIREIDSFLVFPNVGYEWNEYLLESYVASYSKKFSLLSNGYALNNVAGAIVKKDGKIKEFVDVCAAVLADSGISLKKTEALNYLADANLITRRSYRDLDSAIRKATQIRGRKE